MAGNPAVLSVIQAPPPSGSSVSAASQAEMEAASSTTVYASPGRTQYHPGVAKCWAYVTVSGGTPTLQTNFNITSITDTGVGRLTITIATDFSSANWASSVTTNTGSTGTGAGTFAMTHGYASKAAGSIILESFVDNNGGASGMQFQDPSSWDFAGYGDQA